MTRNPLPIARPRRARSRGDIGLAAALLLLATVIAAPARSSTLVPKWGLFEFELRGTANDSNAWRDVLLSAEFTGPDGEVRQVAGFWDGQNRWRIRFAPGQLGEWRYQTACSDVSNAGLHAIAGRFVCTAPALGPWFGSHGPVQVARRGQHFEHADRTPFLWLLDAAWDGARTIPAAAFKRYVSTRATQGFTAVALKLAPDADAEGGTLFTGSSPARINLDFCRRFEAKLTALNQAGLLAVVAPLWEIGVPAHRLLAEDEAAAVLRYVVARWGTHHVAWVIAMQGQGIGARVSRWQRLGREVFGAGARGPVLLLPGDSPWLLDEFRRESWLDALGFQTRTAVNDDGLQWLLVGPLSAEWRKVPPRPLLSLEPPTAGTAGFGAEEARRLLWWSALLGPVAGASWNTDASLVADTWAVAILDDIFKPLEFSRLRPAPEVLANQPGRQSPRRHIAVVGTEAGDLILVYVPVDRRVELVAKAVPRAPKATWHNPRTGESTAANLPAAGGTILATTPAPGDWVLVVQTNQ